jgi:Tfp pilus assembly protein PilF
MSHFSPLMPRRIEIRQFLVPFLLAAVLLSANSQTKPDANSPNPQTASVPVAQPSDSPSAQPKVESSDTLGEGLALERKADFDAAIKKYQQLLEEKPKSPDAYAGLTRVYLDKQDVKQAYETVTKGLQVNDSWPVRVALGEIYFRQGKIPEAEREWADVINSGHQSARAYLGIARVRWAIQMNKSAKLMIDKAHELSPNDPDIERDWAATLPLNERIQHFETFLAGANNLDKDRHENLERYLAYLKELSKQHDSPCRLVSKVHHTETPLVRLLIDPTHLRGYGLAVELNGTRTNIMLDTGASGIVVKRSTASRAGITKLTETKIGGIGDKGLKDAYIGTADSIRIGELEFQNCPVEVIESRSVAGEDGLIGADVFENFLVDIDFPNEKLKLSELPQRPGEESAPLALKNEEDDNSGDQQTASTADASGTNAKDATTKAKFSGPQDRYIAPEMQSYTRVYRFGHDLLVPTSIGDVPNKLFLIDTGSLTNLISPAAAREVTKVHGDSDTILSGINGSVKKVYSADNAVLQFGHLRQKNQDMTAFDMSRISEDHGTEVSGFFGFVLLRFLDIKIDYRDGLVDFAYDATRFGR